MLGKPIFEINENVLVLGASTSNEVQDGGFSPSTTQVNMTNTPGVCFQPAPATDKSTNLTGQMIASCEDPSTSYSRLFVSTDGDADGRFYSSTSDGTLTARGSEDTGANYVQGKTDMVAYKNEAYITNSQYIVRWSGIGGANTFNTTFFDFTSVPPTPSANATTAPHPALVYEDNIYYGNGNILLRQTSAGGTPAAVLTLPAGQVIVALGADPGSGKMLISVIGQINLSDTINSDARVLYYDGFSNKASKLVIVDQMITAFPTSAGAVYAAYGNNLGYWNGAGTTFLRNFSAIGYNNEQLFYKQHFTNIGSTLYFIVRDTLWAHGPIIQGSTHTFYPAKDASLESATDLTHVTNLGSGNLAFSFATSKFYTWNTTSITVGGQSVLHSNEITFDRPYWVRRIKIWFKNPMVSGVTNAGFVQIYADNIFQTPNPGNSAFIKNETGADSYVAEIKNLEFKCDIIQMLINMNVSYNLGIHRIVGYGEPADRP